VVRRAGSPRVVVPRHDRPSPGDGAEERARSILELTADYYWEQDEKDRFTLLLHRDAADPENEPARILGKTPWALDGEPVGTTWAEHRAVRRARQPFTDVVVRIPTHERPRYLSVSGQPVFDAGHYRGYRGVCRDVTAQIRGQHLLDLERQINRILVQERPPEEAIVAAMRTVCEFEGWAAGQYWRLDPEEGVLRIQAGWSGDHERLQSVLRAALELPCGPGMGLIGEVLRTGQVLWVPDLRRDPRALRRDLAEETGWTSSLVAPVHVQGRTIGVLDFNAATIPQPDAPLRTLLHTLGAQLGSFHQRALALEQLRQREERYASLVELAAIGISHVATNGRFLYANRQLCSMLGYTLDELLALTVRDISHPEDLHVTSADTARLRAGEIQSFKAEKRYLRKDGAPIWVRLTIAAERGPDRRILHDVSIVEDVSDRRAAEERVRYLATHDELTGLANRTMFGQLLSHAIEQRRRYGRHFAVMFVDLDRFKLVNDSMGHEGGDLLLQEVATRLRGCLRASDVVARFGGDEFVLLVEELPDRDAAAVVARHVLSAVIQPARILGQECRVTASVGVTMCPDDAEEPAALLKNADLAMYMAKEEGKNAFQFYSPEISVLSSQRVTIEASLRGALERGELTMHYQAKVDVRTGAISGVEALMRWTHPEMGWVPPATFIPIAEETDLIVPIGRWAVRTACAQSATWLAAGLPPVRMAVNLSPRQFTDPDLVTNIASALQETGMRPDLMELEITEGVMMQDVERALDKLVAIRQLGVRLAIDDFGTGYSSLSQLKRLPIDTLKVDRSFIRDLPADAENIGITEAIIAMGKSLGVTVVAEGVETVEQEAFLSARMCHEMQGFLFSRPIPPEDFAELLRTHVPVRRAS